MTETEIDYRLLGPFEVRRGGEIADTGGGKRRGVLATLLLAAPLAVTIDQLIEALWAGAPPRSALNLVQGYVSDWRNVLEPHRRQRSSGQRIASVGKGYRIAVDAAELDVRRFETLVRAARLAREGGNVERAIREFERALAEWRGLALADFAGEPFHAAAASALDGARLDAVETLAELNLEVGRPERALDVVTAALRGSRVRERLVEIRMLALYRLGRQSDALAAYEDVRHVMADELGVDPGSTLRELQIAVLRQDPSLVGPPPTGASLTNVPGLPVPASSFIGRRREVDSVLSLLDRHRLVTLIGTGGSGKTRLALRVAAEVEQREGRPVAFVDLSPIPKADLVCGAIADVLDVRLNPHLEPAEALAAHLAHREILLVLDNVEHVLAAAVDVATVLAATPRCAVLATSREPLALDGEIIFPVPPMPLPSPGTHDVQELRESEAVRLFVERATAASGLAIRDEDLPVVGGICRRLDGLPLALELAAPWTRTLGLRALLERLDHALGLLTLGPRDRPERHRTLRAAIDWSYDGLPAAERALLDGMSVFRSAVQIDAVAAVAEPDRDSLPALSTLIDKNLVTRETDGVAEFYRLLETIREYAAERLATRPEDELAVRDRHASYFQRVFEAATLASTYDDLHDHLPREAQEEVRGALAHLAAVGRPESCLTLALDAFPLWGYRGHLREGLANIRYALDHLDGSDSAALRAAGSVRAADIAVALGDPNLGRTMAEAGIHLARQAGDRCLEAAALSIAGALLQWSRPEDGWRLLEQAIEVASSTVTASTRWSLANPAVVQVIAACEIADNLRFRAPIRAQELLDNALAVAVETDDNFLTSWVRRSLGWLAVDRGDWSQAEALLTDASAFAEQARWTSNAARSHEGLAELAWASDQLQNAVFHARRAIELSREGGHAYTLGRSAARLGDVLLELGQVETAEIVLADADHLLRRQDPVAAERMLAVIHARAARLAGSTTHVPGLLAAAAAAQPPEDLRPDRVRLLLESALLAEAEEDLDGARLHLDTLDRQAETVGIVLPVPIRREISVVRDRLASLDPTANCFRRDQDAWTVRFAGVTARCADSKGMYDLARLLRSPHVEIAAADLVGGEAVAETRMGADPVLDAAARTAYRQRLQELEDEENRADAAGDAQWSSRVQHERDQLLESLRSASGLSGRARLLGEGAERARKAVTARVRDAVERIERCHATLGAHLRESIRTGQRCSYAPPTETTWSVHLTPDPSGGRTFLD